MSEQCMSEQTMTVEQVQTCWEQIRRRIMHRRDGAMIAALLMVCEPVRVEHEQGEQGVPCVVIRGTVAFPVKVLRSSGHLVSAKSATFSPSFLYFLVLFARFDRGRVRFCFIRT